MSTTSFGIGWENEITKRFPMLERMKPHNRGYDFIFECVKIDAKASHLSNDIDPFWKFQKRDTIADIFICGGYEVDILMHVWLIPSSKFYPYKCIKIFKSKLNMFIQFEIKL